ncbi:MAG: hypothetical protein ACD_3C00225G0007 [uncultured bacterium (gcode 4)]|uniref:Uncharacterized protein n=1 Tax=uncultured bacterium (gcode 4) TaxID=1234023 RepID=K2GAV2_9BACT|nr:MAG: hypothetical protein ACD_3C00225G0007 [uncultured bacterium (gcode 4)]
MSEIWSEGKNIPESNADMQTRFVENLAKDLSLNILNLAKSTNPKMDNDSFKRWVASIINEFQRDNLASNSVNNLWRNLQSLMERNWINVAWCDFDKAQKMNDIIIWIWELKLNLQTSALERAFAKWWEEKVTPPNENLFG